MRTMAKFILRLEPENEPLGPFDSLGQALVELEKVYPEYHLSRGGEAHIPVLRNDGSGVPLATISKIVD